MGVGRQIGAVQAEDTRFPSRSRRLHRPNGTVISRDASLGVSKVSKLRNWGAIAIRSLLSEHVCGLLLQTRRFGSPPAVVCKTAGSAYAGSNPASPIGRASLRRATPIISVAFRRARVATG
jgi:hypothetical protein